MENTLQHLDLNQLFRSFDYLDELEKELTKEVNRTHGDYATGNGEIGEKSCGCWEYVISDQCRKLSWRRSRRVKRSEREGEEVGST